MTNLADPTLFIALLAALLTTPLVGRLARAIGCVAAPRRDRLHEAPTPLLGGLALLVSLLAALVLTHRLTLHSMRPAGEPLEAGAALALLAIGAFLLGLADDLLHLAPPVKLAGQVGLCMLLLASGGPGPLPGPVANGVIGFFWIVGLMNACNFLDNMDGVLAGVGALAAAWLLLIAGPTGAGSPAAAWLAGLVGVLLGFLAFNRPRAAIFMGDAGSLLVGLLLGGTAWFVASSGGGRPALWLALPLALAYPIFDVTFVTVTRLARRQPPWVGGRDHTNHRLLARLGGPWRALGVVYGLQCVGGGAALAAAAGSTTAAIVILAAVTLLFTVVGLWLRTIPVR